MQSNCKIRRHSLKLTRRTPHDPSWRDAFIASGNRKKPRHKPARILALKGQNIPDRGNAPGSAMTQK